LGALAAHRFLDAGRNVRTRVLNGSAQSRTFTFARHDFAVHSAAEEHTNLDAITGAAHGGECDESGNAGYEHRDNNSDFQISPL